MTGTVQPARVRRASRFRRHPLVLVAAMLLAGCATGQGDIVGAAGEGFSEVEDLYVVDCMLPGQVRRLGATTYTTPRRPVRTTAQDCELRGGEYVAYDRADYRSALKVWLARAEEGDPEAQNYVGEIFEKGLGREADHVSAASWYRKAAEQGYARAQINLGYLYEKGLGVEQDTATALNWYRRASGLSTDTLVYGSEARKALEDQRRRLQAKIDDARAQAGVLGRRLADTRARKATLSEQVASLSKALQRQDRAEQQRVEELAELRQALATAEEEVDVLRQLRARAEEERATLGEALAGLPSGAYRHIEPPPRDAVESAPETSAIVADGQRFGRYFALIIGAQDYRYLSDLQSPNNDARRVARVLSGRYGFNTTVLLDADQRDILLALNALYERIGPEDNLLIYYAGHGNLSRGRASNVKRGYWLPVDARPQWNRNWIHNAVISDHLDRMRARSVIVVADSCYAGDMASKESPFLFGVDNTLSQASLEIGLQRRARVVIASGGEAPVLDTADGEHSIFARSLIEVLERNERILNQSMLFSQVAVNVRQRTRGTAVEQTPEMRPIRAAGHEGGDFYFVPRTALN